MAPKNKKIIFRTVEDYKSYYAGKDMTRGSKIDKYYNLGKKIAEVAFEKVNSGGEME